MNQERKANSSLIRILWAVIKQQKPATASTSKIVKFLMTEGGLTESNSRRKPILGRILKLSFGNFVSAEAEDAVKDAVEDGLLEINSNSSTPARNARKSPTRTYRIPSEVGVSVSFDMPRSKGDQEPGIPRHWMVKSSHCPTKVQ